NFGTMTKPLHAGNACRNGIIASSLAKGGFTADFGILEGVGGFFDMFTSGEVAESRPESDDFNKNWCIISTGISFKPYPCCRATHSSIDAALELRKAYKINGDEISAIICKHNSQLHRLLRYHQPITGLEAKFCVEYCVSATILRGKLLLEDFKDDKVNQAEVQDLIKKTKCSHFDSESMNRSAIQPTEVLIKLKNGTEYSQSTTIARGDPRNPLTDKELLTKFKDCLSHSACIKYTDQIIDTLSNIESIDSISIKNLMRILSS
ncbi:MAG: MmgE/PrpD family protein, partial [Dehalococcoidia bacterium]